MGFPSSIVLSVTAAMEAFAQSHLADMQTAAQLAEYQSELLSEMNQLLEKKADAVRKADKDHLIQAQTEYQAASQKVQSLESMAAANTNQATNMVANGAKAQQDLQQFASFAIEVLNFTKSLTSSPI